jgi:hypothetical protein
MSDKLGSSIRNDGLRPTMQTQDEGNIHLRVLLSPVVGVHRNEMRRLNKPVDNYPNGVKPMGRERQTHNKIHADVFPFCSRNIQRLQQSGRSRMISLDPSTRVTFCNIASSLALDSSPPYQISSCTAPGSLEPPDGPRPIECLHHICGNIDLGISFGQPSLDMAGSIITAVNCSDHPS